MKNIFLYSPTTIISRFVFQNTTPEIDTNNTIEDPHLKLDQQIKLLEEMQQQRTSEKDRQDLLELIEDTITMVHDAKAQEALKRLDDLGVTITNLDPIVFEKRTPMSEIVFPADQAFDDYFGENTSKYLIPGEDFTYTDKEGNLHTTNLLQQSQSDASLFREENMGKENFKQALQNAVLDGLIAKAPADPDKLFDLLNNGCNSSEDVKMIQSMLSSMDGTLADTIKKEDGKYGINTSKGIRRLSAFLKREDETRVNVELAALNILKSPQMPQKPVRPEMGDLAKYDRVIILRDNTRSMIQENTMVDTEVDFIQNQQQKLNEIEGIDKKTDFVKSDISSVGEYQTPQSQDAVLAVGERRELSFVSLYSELNRLERQSGKTLIKIYTDDGFQGVNDDKFEQIVDMSRQKNIEVVFVRLQNDAKQEITLSELHNYYKRNSEFARDLYITKKMERYNDSYNKALEAVDDKGAPKYTPEQLRFWNKDLDRYENRLKTESDLGFKTNFRNGKDVIKNVTVYSFDIPDDLGKSENKLSPEEQDQKLNEYEKNMLAYKEALQVYNNKLAVYNIEKADFDRQYAQLAPKQKARVDKLLANK